MTPPLARFRTGVAIVAAAALSAVGAPVVQAAPGEWTSTYDWQASPTTGFGGWGSFETYAVGPGGYYSAFQNGPLGLGLSMRPTGGRVYSNANPNSEVGGPKQVWQLNAPGTTRIRQGTFDHVDYAGTGERQFLRLALYGDDIEDTKYDYTPPNVNDDGPRVVTRPPFQPGAQNTQLWLYTSCPKDPPSAPAACPFVPNPSNSKGRVGKVVLDLTDPEPPAINATGPLFSGGWSQGRGPGAARLVATDPGSGVANVRLAATEPGRPPRLVSSQNAPCDPAHTQPKPPGREAAVCPDSYTTDAADQPSRVPEGATTYTATATDLSQRTGSRSWTVRIDRSKPTRLTGTGPLTRLYRKWTNSRRSHALIASASDSLSGVARLEVRDGSTVLAAKDNACKTSGRPCPRRWSTPLDVDLGRLREGRHRLSLRASDIAGNVAQPRSLGELLIDRTAPTAPRGRVRVSSNGTTARWSSYDRLSRLDFFRVRIERPGGRTAFRAVRPAEGRETTTRSGRLFQPGVKAAAITVAAHDRAGNVAAARIRCNTPARRKYCSALARARPKKRKRRPRRAASAAGSCKRAVSQYATAVRAYGAAVSDYRKKAGAQAAAEQRTAKSALEWRDAAKRYEARASENSPAQTRRSKALAHAYQRAFRRFADTEKTRKKTRARATRAEDEVKRQAEGRGRAARKVFACGRRTRAQGRKLVRWAQKADRLSRQFAKARKARRKATKNLRILRIRRQALSARGRGLLKTTDAAAKAYQPILNVDRSDGFWPVLFSTISKYQRERAPINRFGERPSRGHEKTCIKDDENDGDCLIENVTPDMLRSHAGKDKHLDYPAPSDDQDKQHDMLMRAAGGYGQQPAMYYFKTLGEEGRRGYLHAALQYWFYYSYNYQPGTGGTTAGGRHEGDFEHVAIVLSRNTGRPRYVFMARHDKDEARRQREPLRYYYDPLDRPKGIRQEGTHIKVYAAHGSHASYPRCDEWTRIGSLSEGKRGLPNDNTCRGPVKTFGTDTPLINVARSPWACWQGRFGEPGPSQSTRSDGKGPESPLVQQKDYYAIKDPCKTGRKPETGPLRASASGRAGTPPSASPSGPPAPDAGGDPDSLESEIADEADLPQADVVRREQAGAHYDRYFDDCGDWNTPPLQRGIKIVACDQRILSRFFAGGLEDPGPERLRIVDPARVTGSAGTGDVAIPPVYETGDAAEAGRLTVTADGSANPAVEAFERGADGSVLRVRFPPATVAAGRQLRVQRGRSAWRLVDGQGRTVATARPRVAVPLAAPTAVRARKSHSLLRVSWRTSRQPPRTRFAVYVAASRTGSRRLVAIVRRRPGVSRYARRLSRAGRARFVRVVALTGNRRAASPLTRVQR